MRARDRLAFALVTLGLGCSSGGAGRKSNSPEHVAPPLVAPEAGGEGGEAVSSGGESAEHEPEIVHTGQARSLDLAGARVRYTKRGSKCGGIDAPDQTIGPPDQRNEMEIGRAKVVIFGYLYPQGTLVIRCKNDHVESSKVLKK